MNAAQTTLAWSKQPETIDYKDKQSPQHGAHANRWLLIGLCSVTWLTVLRFAWLSDDSLITGRVVLNFTNGDGPIYNLGERVQAYTHPLWFMLWSGAAWVTGEVILTPIALGLTFSAIALGILAFCASTNMRAILAIGGLALCPAFIYWSTSGLENSLTMALIGALWLVATRRSTPWMAAAGGIAAAMMLNRLDLVILVAPILGFMVWRAESWKGRAALVCSAIIPVAIWLGSAYLYYGYALPATFYAKTNVVIPRSELVMQGFRYWFNLAEKEPQSALLFVIGCGSMIAARTKQALVWVIGIVAYGAYVAWVGGDFMSGRFMSAPLFIAALGIATYFPSDRLPARLRVPLALAILATMALLGFRNAPLISTERAPMAWEFENEHGIADERGWYIEKSAYGLTQYVFDQRGDDGAVGIAKLRGNAASNWNQKIKRPTEVRVACGLLGGAALDAGPRVHYVDTCGLADMYIAQTPFNKTSDSWRIGHFERVMPEGYLESLATGSNQVVDPEAARALDEVWERSRHEPVPIP